MAENVQILYTSAYIFKSILILSHFKELNQEVELTSFFVLCILSSFYINQVKQISLILVEIPGIPTVYFL